MITEPMLVREINRVVQAIEQSGMGGSGTGSKSRDKDREITLRDRLTRGMNFAVRQVKDFADALLPIPHSLGQLVKQTTQAAAPGAMSTLEKSWRLVQMQIGRVFLPAILAASKALQDFARTLKRWREEPLTGKETAADKVGKGLFQGLPALFGAEGDLVREENRRARRGGGGIEGAMGPARAAEQARHDMRFQMARLGGIFRLGAMAMGRAEREAGGGPGPRKQETMGPIRAAMMSSAQGKGPGLLHDLRPPGYQAQYTAFEDARRNLQMAALNQTPLDVKLMQEEVEIMKEILRTLQKQREPAIPPQKGR